MITEKQARTRTICPKCLGYKNIGLSVCWDCFKYIDEPWKTSNKSWDDWLSGMTKQEREQITHDEIMADAYIESQESEGK